MNNIHEIASTLLEGGKVKLIIGYEQGTEKPRPLLCTSLDDIQRLIFNNECKNNLATYLTKKELTGDGVVAIFATYYVIKSIIQLNKENQINKENLIVLTADKDESIIELKDFDEMENFVVNHIPTPDPNVVALLEKIDKMTREERWTYWKNELSKCIRCYACRAACPFCYCNRCITEVNCPQWIDSWASTLSNIEWQINRVMHMSGRCVGCGACEEACPLDLPIGILAKKMATDIAENFKSSSEGNVLSTYNPNDKENFIH